jgi:hypothetical protein
MSDELPTGLPTDTCRTSPGLREVMDAWDDLPEGVRSSVLMLVRASRKDGAK